MGNITPVEILMLNYVRDGIKSDMKFPGYWQYQYGVNAQEVVVELLNKNLLEIADADVSLQHMEVKELKQILSSAGLKVSGKKADLVERIFNEINKQSLLSLGLPTYLTRTDAGEKVLEENARPDMKEYYEAKLIYGDDESALSAVKLISARKFKDAEKYIKTRQEYKSEEFEEFLDFHVKALDEYTGYEDKIKSCIIYSVMAGGSRSDLANYLMIGLYGIDIPKQTVNRVMKYLTGIKRFLDTKKFAEVLPKSKYTICTMKDERTCKACRKREGKLFLASKAELGVNYPPFDDCKSGYCRCFASTVIKKE